MLTTVMAGTLILMGAAWSWSRLAVVSIPITGYSLSVTQVNGNLAPAETVDLLKGREKIGTAVVESYAPLAGDGSGVAKVKDLTLDKGRIASDIDHVRHGDAASPTFTGVVAGRDPKFLFPKVYLQAGVASLIVLLGGFFLHRSVASRPSTVDFLVATDSEMKKVNWSTRQVIQDSTIVVIGATFLIAGFIFVADIGLRMLMEFIGVLATS
jgi:preprotein translocase SecE subunit